MMKKLIAAGLFGVVLAPSQVDAQVEARTRASVLFESYSFDAGLELEKVSELTVPIGVDISLGQRGRLTLSSGYLSVNLTSAIPDALDDQSISGLLDTEIRATYDAIPGRLVIIANGAIPTGNKTVLQDEVSVLAALSSDLIGFSSQSVGSGGNVGGGFAAALPLGRHAIGFGATGRYSLSYLPIEGFPDELRPGFEFRIRTGFEGPIARRTYIRFAGVFARRAKDELGGQIQNGIGNRYIGYLSVNQGIGNGSITLYGFDVFRADPQLEATVVGTAALPRGNLLALGTRFDWPLSPMVRVAPRVEFRSSRQAPDAASSELEDAGSSIRVGSDVRINISPRAAAVLQGSFATGDIVRQATEVGFDGYRFGLQIEVTP